MTWLVLVTSAAALVAVYSIFIEPRWLRVRTRHVVVPTLPASADGLTILHISDLHVGYNTATLARLLERAARVSADVVAITGDFIETPTDAEEMERVLARFMEQRDGPVLAVLGNHDAYVYRSGLQRRHLAPFRRGRMRPYSHDHIVEELGRLGITLLVDDSIEVRSADRSVRIAGVDIASHDAEGVARALNGYDPESVVLLAHSPDIAGFARDAGVPLVLCGHTHGGQVRMLPWLAPDTSTNGLLVPPAGLLKRGATQVHVSPGLGTTAFPVRFLSRPEATLITLHTR